MYIALIMFQQNTKKYMLLNGKKKTATSYWNEKFLFYFSLHKEISHFKRWQAQNIIFWLVVFFHLLNLHYWTGLYFFDESVIYLMVLYINFFIAFSA